MCGSNNNKEKEENPVELPAKKDKGDLNTGEPNASSGDTTDARKRYDWITRYPPQARKEIRGEATLLFIVFLVSLLLLFATWKNWLSMGFLLPPIAQLTFKKYSYYASAGLLGGITFGMKYFYRVVARGYWHQDRRMWRIMSPFIAMAIALITGMLIDSSLLVAQKPIIPPAIVAIGFLSGYFADEAVGKMYEIASVIFGRSAMMKARDDE